MERIQSVSGTGRPWAWAMPLLLMLAGCLGACSGTPEGGAAPDAGNASFTGGWLRTRNGCEQRLILEEGGEFSLSARIGLSGSTRLEQVDGRYTRLDGDGAPRLVFTPEDGLHPAAVLYCDQWLNRSELLLDFEVIAGLGVDVNALQLRTEISPVLGSITVGTDAAHTDRYAIYQRGDGSLVEVALTNPDPVIHPLYRTDFADPNHDLPTINNLVVLNIPQSSWRGTFRSVMPSTSVEKLLLNAASASVVEFGAVAGTGLPPCDFSIHSDPNYSTLVSSFTFASGQQSHSETYNPSDPGAFFFGHIVTVNGVSAVAYTIPLSIDAPDSGDCAISIRARSLVLPLLEALERQGHAALISHNSPGPGLRLTQFNAAAPAGLMFGKLPAGLVPARARLYQSVVSLLPLSADKNGNPPLHDRIDLLQMKDGAITVDVEETDQGAFLNLFPEGESTTALGSLAAIEDHGDAALLAVPSATDLLFTSGEQAQFYRLELNAKQRLAIWTEGGLKLAGELYSSSGHDLARDRGGAPDGAGFQIVRDLPGRSYILAVRRQAAAGAYVLRVEGAVDFSFADDALGACLIEAGWAAGASISGFNCAGRGVASLAGLEGVTTLQRVALGDNRLTDVSALQSLTGLRELSLDSNMVSDISPLAGLARLERLGLAGNPLGANALAVLGSLGSLTHLDLRGVPTLTVSQAGSLKEKLVHTLIIAPDATVFD